MYEMLACTDTVIQKGKTGSAYKKPQRGFAINVAKLMHNFHKMCFQNNYIRVYEFMGILLVRCNNIRQYPPKICYRGMIEKCISSVQ